MDMSYVFFMAETEGLLSTRLGKINATIKDIKDYPEEVADSFVVEKILNKYGLSISDLSSKEISYIKREISR